MPPTLLDTDILSLLMRSDTPVLERAKTYLSSHSRLSISIITRYEILRGLMAKNAAAQLRQFEVLCASLEVLPLSDAVVCRAATIYAALHQGGQLIGDADILIAATSLENGWALASNNGRHLSRIAGLNVNNWHAP